MVLVMALAQMDELVSVLLPMIVQVQICVYGTWEVQTLHGTHYASAALSTRKRGA